LQVLDGLDPARALSQLEAWARQTGTLNWAALPACLEGACDAALTSTGLELASWLHGQGCPAPAIRQLALQNAVLTFELDSGLELAEGALRERLHQLLSLATL
jgi:hypothetical protein